MKEVALHHLLTLLDDPDEAVRPVVREQLLSMGIPIVGKLRRAQQGTENAFLADRITQIIDEIVLKNTQEGLSDWEKEPDPELLKGLCLISHCIEPDCEYPSLWNQAFSIAQDVCLELSDAKTAVEKVQIFHHIFCHRARFEVVDPFMQQMEAGLMQAAFATRKCNPVIFGMYYMTLALQVGLPVRAVAFPGGFLPAYLDENGQVLFYINIYQSGNLLDLSQLQQFFAGFGFSFAPEAFKLVNACTLAGIYTESLYFLFGNREDKGREKMMEQLLSFFGDTRYLLIEEDDGV
jgi:hypothetical protein